MNIIKSYFDKYKYTVILLLLSIVLIFTNCLAIRQCNSYKDINNNNIVALTDSIHHYKTKTGELYVSKTLLMGDLKTLQLANDSLYNVIKDMKLKDVQSVVHFNTTVDNAPKDTTWNIDKTEPTDGYQITYPMLDKSFAFVDKYRELTGNVFLNDTILGLNIVKDKVFLDYTVAIENNKVFIKSNNPYVQYNEIQGLTLPQPKKEGWMKLVIGPSINYAYDFKEKRFAPSVGVSVTYGFNLSKLIKK